MSRGRIPAATKMAMRVLSVAERLLHAEYELFVLARNPGQPAKSAVEPGVGARLPDAGSRQATSA
jgi:hypothetical protein